MKRMAGLDETTSGELVGATDSAPPAATTPAALRWWANRCSNYGGLERAFNEAAAALETALSAKRQKK